MQTKCQAEQGDENTQAKEGEPQPAKVAIQPLVEERAAQQPLLDGRFVKERHEIVETHAQGENADPGHRKDKGGKERKGTQRADLYHTR